MFCCYRKSCSLRFPGFTLNGEDAGKVLADGTDSLVVFQLARGLLETEI